MQLGPITVTPAAAARSARSRSTWRPSSPVSENPAAIDHGDAHAAAAALLEHRSDLRPADGEERHVRGLGQLLDAGVHRQAEELAASGLTG